MLTFGDLITESVGLFLARGQVYRLPNHLWEVFGKATSSHHPGLVCHPAVRSFAPGTSVTMRTEEERYRLGAYTLRKSNSPNDKPSTFFLKLRREVEEEFIGKYWWTIDNEDLLEVSVILGQERDA